MLTSLKFLHGLREALCLQPLSNDAERVYAEAWRGLDDTELVRGLRLWASEQAHFPAPSDIRKIIYTTARKPHTHTVQAPLEDSDT